jgi:hypothetical protein
MADDDDLSRAQREFGEGLEHISIAFVEAALAAGVSASKADIRLEPAWKSGKPIPSAVRMSLAAPGAPVMLVNLAREQIEDCWHGLDRPEVRQLMREVTSRYLRMQGK